MIVSFVIEGVPVAKGRPRISTRGGFARAYTPEKTRTFEQLVAHKARAAMGSIDPYADAVEVEAHFVLPVPKSWSKRDRLAALSGAVRPIGKPDIDNYFKAICDGMNAVVYKDDSQIVNVRMSKRYGEEPGVAVSVREQCACAES